MKENPIQKRILLACSFGLSRLFRNNIGAFKDERGNWIRFGVGGKGGADLLGWRQVTITEANLGQTVAVFAAIEVKAKGKKPTKEQQMFLDMVRRAGGISGVCRSPEEALHLLTQLDY